MRKQTISVTEAARNFADCVNRAHYQNVTFVLLKNGSPVARLVPDNEKICTGRDLAKALAGVELSSDEAAAWHRDLQTGEKGAFDLQKWAASRPDDEFEVAAITVAELWHGVERAVGAVKLKRQQYLQMALAPFPIVAYTEQTAHEHARIWAELAAAGQIIGYYDMIVAATALERGSEVATFNRKHFAQVKGLTVIEPK